MVTVHSSINVVKSVRQIEALDQFVCNICYNSHLKYINNCQIMAGVNCNTVRIHSGNLVAKEVME